ncbi:LLM class flavin-dependent oxidoreductase [Amycolatopsis silviterrae]|uniref:LLM class flavin-dependent oxidoreductase n=1 Tax=Amycolatopsis silviterrae TaxID=1656914 RepID=A0ABW5HGT2_9PSEU
MRVDLLHALENKDDARPWHEVLEQARRRFVLADQLGIDGIWIGEHHFDHMGVDQSPNPALLLADLASRTSWIRIGIAAVILPAWHPIRLAEDLAMLDQMTGGRLDVALSRGILRAEIINLNAEADRSDDARSKAIFAERLGLLRAAWAQDPLKWSSERFEFPHPDTKWPGGPSAYTDENGKATGMAVIPRPHQTGGPPLYSVTDTTGGFVSAAQQGLKTITWFPTRGILDGLNASYRDEAERGGGTPLQNGSAVLRGCLIAPTDAEARELAEPEVTSSFAYIEKVRGIKVWLDEGEDPDDPAIRATPPFDLLFERDHLLVGSPDTVAEKMIQSARANNAAHWVLAPSLTENDHCVERTMRLLAEEVLPKVRAAVDD